MDEFPLREFQQWMKRRIREHGPVVAPSAAAPVNPQRGTPGEVRIASVYGGAYVTRIQDALAEVYDAVRFVLGEGTFAQLAHDYTARHPSQDYNLSFAGRHLPEFLAASPLTVRLPFLPDLARLEWLVCQAFHAFDQPPADLAQFASLPLEQWEQIRVQCQPSVGLVSSAWPIRDIWAARTQPRDAVRIDVVSRPQHVVVRRDDLTVTCELLEERAALLLARLLAGETLGAACGALAQLEGIEVSAASVWFNQWARQGLIARLEH